MPRKKKRVGLFPLTEREQNFMRLVYETLQALGRLPRMREWINRVEPACTICDWNHLIERLTRRGWLHRCEQWSWWPVGVDRTITFRYPATTFVKKNLEFHVKRDNIQEPTPESEPFVWTC